MIMSDELKMCGLSVLLRCCGMNTRQPKNEDGK